MQRDIESHCRPVSLEKIRWIPRRRGPQKADTPDLIISFKEDYSALREREKEAVGSPLSFFPIQLFLEPCFLILFPCHIPCFPFVRVVFILSPLLWLITLTNSFTFFVSNFLPSNTFLFALPFFLFSSKSHSLFLSLVLPDKSLIADLSITVLFY